MRSLFCTALFFVGAARTAHADRQEWRLSLAGVVTDAMAERSSSAGAGINPGARARFGYGVRNWLELGGSAGFSWAPGVVFPKAVVDKQPGNLNADVIAVEMAGSIRLQADVPFGRAFFARNRPFVDVRTGLLLEIVRAPKLLDQNGDIVLALSETVTPRAFVGAALGLEHRIAGAWLGGISVDYVYAGSAYQSVGCTLEVSWMTY